MNDSNSRRTRIIVINGTSGTEDEDNEFRNVLRMTYLSKGHPNMKAWIYALMLKDEPDLQPFIARQIEEKRKYWPRKVHNASNTTNT